MSRKNLGSYLRFTLLGLGIAAAGCEGGSTTLQNGLFPCSTSSECPVHYHCAAKDHMCWQNGTDPGMGPGTPVDPNAKSVVWLSGGGGRANVNTSSVNMSIGGSALGTSSVGKSTVELGGISVNR